MAVKPKTKATDSFSDDEKAAMKARAAELKAEKSQADAEKLALAAIKAFPADDRKLAEWLHKTIKAEAPALAAKTWYGMPAYALDGKTICFFQGASKFKARYATLGFSDNARLDEGRMWPTAFALTDLGPDDEARIKALIRKAAGIG